MKKLRKSISSLVIAVMIFTVVFQAALASSNATGFSDVKGHWAEAKIARWAERGVIAGANGKFRPDAEITRAEFCAIINRVFGFSEKSKINFPDVKPGSWYEEQAAIAKEAGYISGYGNNLFNPDEKIARQDAATMLKTVFKLEKTDSSRLSFDDSADIAAYAKDAVSALAAQGYISGYNNRFRPKKNITRSEVITILDNIVEQLYSEAGTYSNKDIQGNVIVNSADVTLKDIKISGDLYLADGIGQGSVTLDNVAVDGRTFVNGGGENSIILNNTTLTTLIVMKKDGKVRIIAKGGAAASDVKVYSGAMLREEDISDKGFENIKILEIPAGQQIVLDGSFDAVSLEASGATVQVADGTIGTLTVAGDAAGANVQIAQSAKLETLIADAAVNIGGQGRITTARINADEVVIEQTPANIIIAAGTTASVGGRIVGRTAGGGDSASGGNGGPGNPEMWTLVWSDEFNGTELDAAKWRLEDKGDGFGNQELQYYSPGNAAVQDGKLVITARKVADPENYNGKNYTSAKLFSKADWKYGKFEARIKLPTGQGFWPAFWMMPADSVYGGWAASGEIDIMEARGRLPGVVSGTLHYGGAWPNNKYTGKEYTFPAGQSIGQFHTYSLEWEPGEIRWYVDGNLYQVQNNWNTYGAAGEEKYAFPAPFDQNFYLMLNLAIGGTFDGGLYPEDGMFPATMEVDYVRVYKLTGRPYKTPVEPGIEKEALPEGARQPDENGNLVYDVNFDNGIKDNAEGVDAEFGEGWNFVHNAAFGGVAAASVVDIGGKNYAKIDVANKGSQPYAVQLEQHTTLGKGRWYEFSFDAKADKARTLVADLSGGPGAGWAKYSDVYTVNLTDEIRHFTYRFQMTRDSDIKTRIEFNCATDTGAVYIGNVCVKEVDPPAVDYNASKDPLPVSGNHIYNGAFDKYLISRMAYWNVTKSGATANVSVPEATRELAADIIDGGATASALTLDQKGIKLANGNEYKLSFKARSAAARTIKVRIAGKDGSADYLPEQEISLTTGMQTFEVPFKMEAASDNESQLIFMLGGNNSDVYIDDVSLLKTTIDYSKIDMYPMKNGDFSNGLDKWGNWAGEGGAASISAENGEAKISVTNAGSQPWSVQFFEDGLNLAKDMQYVVAFDIRSTKARKIEISLENSSYTRYFTKVIDVGTDTLHFEETFAMAKDELITFKFLLGKTDSDVAALGAHDIFIDNVVCEVKDAKFLTSVIKNGRFNSGLDPWAVWTGDGGAADATVVDGTLKIGVVNAGPNSWSVQVFQEGLTFENGQRYKISFKAKADTARNINVNIGKALTADPWFIPYMPMQTYSLANTMQEFTYEFTMNEATYNNAKMVFEAGNVSGGNAATNIYIDDVAVNKVMAAVVATPTFTPAPGAFENEQTVAISCATGGATIRYTTDGSTPNAASTVYSGPIAISQTTTIKAYAAKDGMIDSDVASATYTKSHGLLNGDFGSGMDNWRTYFGDGSGDGNTVIDVVGGALKVDCKTYDGWFPWSIQVYQDNINLKANKAYVLSFDISSTLAGKTVKVDIEKGSDYNVKYLPEKEIILTTGVQTLSYEFATGETGELNAKLLFMLGSNNVPVENFVPHVITIDNITLTEKTGDETPGIQLATKWYLYMTPVDGVTPAGENMQDSTTVSAAGWQPTKVMATTEASYWYSPAASGTYTAGDWEFTLWTDEQPAATFVEVSIYIVEADGGNPQLIAAAAKDVAGSGNHPTTFNFAGISAKTLTNQRLMVRIAKQSNDGKTVTMGYNPVDFPTCLDTPAVQ